MRIISQDTTWDLQYEQIAIKQVDNTILFSDYSLDTSHVLAHYSTKEKASEIMQELRDAYVSYNMFKVMTENQKVDLLNGDISIQEQLILGGTFYLPADDEENN